MYKPNIISAGKMMAIVVMLFGVLHVASSFAPVHAELVAGRLETVPHYSVIAGALLLGMGIALLVLFGMADRKPSLDTPILVIGTLIAICGVLAVALVYKNPFSWMTGILGLAVFINSLCLKLLPGSN